MRHVNGRPTYTPREMLERLVAFDTTSRRSNLELIEFVENYLSAYGVPHWRAGTPDGQKTNLCATVGGSVPGGIVLSGHSDVVPVDGQPWTSDPWKLVEREGKRSDMLMARTRDFKTVMLPPDGVAVGSYCTVELTGTTGSTFTGALVRDDRPRRDALPMLAASC